MQRLPCLSRGTCTLAQTQCTEDLSVVAISLFLYKEQQRAIQYELGFFFFVSDRGNLHVIISG